MFTMDVSQYILVKGAHNQVSSMNESLKAQQLRRSGVKVNGPSSVNAPWECRREGPSCKSGVTLTRDKLGMSNGSNNEEAEDGEGPAHNEATKIHREFMLRYDDGMEQLLLKLRSTTFIGTFDAKDHADWDTPSSSWVQRREPQTMTNA